MGLLRLFALGGGSRNFPLENAAATKTAGSLLCFRGAKVEKLVVRGGMGFRLESESNTWDSLDLESCWGLNGNPWTLGVPVLAKAMIRWDHSFASFRTTGSILSYKKEIAGASDAKLFVLLWSCRSSWGRFNLSPFNLMGVMQSCIRYSLLF